MLKFKNFRSLFLVLGVIILLIISVGCAEANTLDDERNIQMIDEEQQKSGMETGDLYAMLFTTMATEDNEIASFCAETYIQDSPLSWVYSLDIKVENGKIYINDILYEESPSVPPTILYNDGFLGHADYVDEMNGNKEVSDMLSKIKNCDTCYLLETKQDSKFGQKMSVYKIDGAYYFIRFYDSGEVMRIHRAIIK